MNTNLLIKTKGVVLWDGFDERKLRAKYLILNWLPVILLLSINTFYKPAMSYLIYEQAMVKQKHNVYIFFI